MKLISLLWLNAIFASFVLFSSFACTPKKNVDTSTAGSTTTTSETSPEGNKSSRNSGGSNNGGGNGDGGDTSESATAIPSSTASSLSFVDSDFDSGELGGSITIAKASSESDIESYELYWGTSDSTKATLITTVAVTGANITYSLPASTTIPSSVTHILVYAKNSMGLSTSAASVVISDSVPQAAPPNPTGVAATNVTSTSLTLSWTSGGGTTASYKYAYSDSGTPANCNSGTSTTSTSVSVTGLDDDTQYYFLVCALNQNTTPDVSTGTSNGSIIRTLKLAPTDPTITTVDRDSTTQLTVNWTSGGGTTTGFKLAYQQTTAPTNCASGTVIDIASSGTTSQIVTTGLSAGNTYGFRLCAINDNPTPDVSTGVTTTAATLQTAPGNPASITISNITNTTLTITWPAVTGATGYKYAYGTPSAPANCNTATSTTNVTAGITGLTAASSYEFRVCAYNSNPTPDVSSGVTNTATTLVNPPSAPTTLTPTVVSTTAIDLNWTNVANETGYELYISTDNSTWTAVSTTIAADDTSESVTGKDPGTLYYFRVLAKNAGGNSGWATTNATTLQTAPPNPSNLVVASDTGTTSIGLTWTSGGGSTTGYYISFQAGATAPADCTGATDTSSSASATITVPAAHTAYSFRVCAGNGNTPPDKSSGITVTALRPTPPNPINFSSSSVTSSGVTLSWSGNGGTTHSYKVAYAMGASYPSDCSSGTPVSPATSPEVITGLSPATQYSFRVCALNNNPTASVSSGTTGVQITTNAAPPVPSAFSAAATSGISSGITLSFTSGGGTTNGFRIAYKSGATPPTTCTSDSTTTAASGDTTKAITGLSSSTEYSFRICAIDSSSTESATSLTASATTSSAGCTPASLYVSSYSVIGYYSRDTNAAVGKGGTLFLPVTLNNSYSLALLKSTDGGQTWSTDKLLNANGSANDDIYLGDGLYGNGQTVLQQRSEVHVAQDGSLYWIIGGYGVDATYSYRRSSSGTWGSRETASGYTEYMRNVSSDASGNVYIISGSSGGVVKIHKRTASNGTWAQLDDTSSTVIDGGAPTSLTQGNFLYYRATVDSAGNVHIVGTNFNSNTVQNIHFIRKTDGSKVATSGITNIGTFSPIAGKLFVDASDNLHIVNENGNLVAGKKGSGASWTWGSTASIGGVPASIFSTNSTGTGLRMALLSNSGLCEGCNPASHAVYKNATYDSGTNVWTISSATTIANTGYVGTWGPKLYALYSPGLPYLDSSKSGSMVLRYNDSAGVSLTSSGNVAFDAASCN